MVRRKKIRTRGKFSLSRYFQELKKGDAVAVVKERSVKSSFPSRLQGRTGKVASKRGRSYVIQLKDQNKEKQFIIKPIHLRKINNELGAKQ